MREEKVKIIKEIKEAALSLPNLAMLFTQPVSVFDQCTISKTYYGVKDDQRMGSSMTSEL